MPPKNLPQDSDEGIRRLNQETKTIYTMAEDTRDSTTSGPSPIQNGEPTNVEDSQRPKPKYEAKSQVGKLWDAFGNPEEPVNMLPGAGSKGEKNSDVTVTDAMKSMSLKDATSFYKAPCARDSLLLGIGAGFGVGGVRGVLGGKRSLILRVCHYKELGH